ncbi:hypothetical protein HKX48_005243 [Thoreauomyces humboldtii]|nr:hypothetical protein HKX48_005243 [Thoreauomyces humboldtii]
MVRFSALFGIATAAASVQQVPYTPSISLTGLEATLTALGQAFAMVVVEHPSLMYVNASTALSSSAHANPVISPELVDAATLSQYVSTHAAFDMIGRIGCGGADSGQVTLNASTNLNFAAIWLRTAFHDAGTYDPTALVPTGGDGSISAEFHRTDNAGFLSAYSVASQSSVPLTADAFMLGLGLTSTDGKTQGRMSLADTFAIGAAATLRLCGGPQVRVFPGRQDLPNLVPMVDNSPQNGPPGASDPDGLLPSPSDTYDVAKQKFTRMGLSLVEMLLVVTGSHTLGGVRHVNNPDLTTEAFVAFDNTPGLFDNDVFARVLEGHCPLPLDCSMAKDPLLIDHVKAFAANQTLFFEQYAVAMEKMLNLTSTPLVLPPVTIDFDPGLLARAMRNPAGLSPAPAVATAAAAATATPATAAAARRVRRDARAAGGSACPLGY